MSGDIPLLSPRRWMKNTSVCNWCLFACWPLSFHHKIIPRLFRCHSKNSRIFAICYC